MKNKILLFISIVLLLNLGSAVLLSDQGTDVIEISSGELLDFGNLSIEIYDDSSGGDLIHTQTFPNGIVNGSWNVMMDPDLEYGVHYWKDYIINGENLDFDGNDRLEFQSPLGLINNVDYINLSLISSCPAGSSIRLVYQNGSVECESDESGSGEADLTNYALKNQSESFTGNISVTGSGFFGFLGSLANRITKIFVNELDVSGNVEVGGNISADYFIGDGSQLTNLPALSDKTHLSNFSDDLGNRGYTSLNNFSNDPGYINSSQLSLYNDTGLIYSINLSLNSRIDGISSSSTYNATYAQFAYNQTLAANLYTDILNATYGKFWYNMTTSSTGDGSYNLSYERFAYNQTYTGGTYNSTYDAKISANNSWNQSLANTLYAPISVTGGNASFNQSLTDGIYIKKINETNLNVNSTSWWAQVTGWASGWFIRNGNNLDFNETRLNLSIDNRVNLYNETDYINSIIERYYNKTQIDNNLSLYLFLTDQRYNDTQLIDLVNSTLNSRINSLSANNSWNQTLANSIYYSINNPNNFINITDARVFNETLLINSINNSILNYISNNEANWSSSNEGLFLAENLTIWNAINNRLIISDARYNETALIISINNSIWTILSDKMSLSDQRYNETTLINAVNSSLSNRIDSIQSSTYNSTYHAITVDVNANRTAWLSTFNSTYAQFAYNQTYTGGTYNSTYDAKISANNSWNQSLANTLYAPISVTGGNASFNQSFTSTLYAGIQWAYNQTISAINDINLRFWNKTQVYNKTEIDLFNASWSSTFNASYASLNATYGKFWYNMTTSSTGDGSYNISYERFAYNQTYTGGTFNSTYAQYSYNQSDGSFNVSYNHLLGQQCPAGRVVNGTLANGTLSCTIDQTGSGGSGPQYMMMGGRGTAALSADSWYNPAGGVLLASQDFSQAAYMPYSGRIQNLSASLSTIQGAGDTCTLNVMSSSTIDGTYSSVISCTMQDAVTNCKETASSGIINSGDYIKIFFDEQAGTCSGIPAWNFIYQID